MRGDIAAAASRMRVLFGTRSAMKHLVNSLEAGEHVREMVACLYAGANGLLVLTDRRVLALRDDYSRYALKAAVLDEITLIDYGPKVHDGFAVFSDSGRVAVRKMHREDADRLVEVLSAGIPTIPVVTSHPTARASKNARLTSHAKHVAPAPTSGPVQPTADPASVTVPVSGPEGSSTEFVSNAAITGVEGPSTGSLPAVPAPVLEPIPEPVVPAPAHHVEPAQAGPTDKEVLYGVLADLHARGLLTAEELAVKVAAVAAKP